MPSYEHICTDKDCNFEWEDMYSIKADPPKVCPNCKKETAQRVISGGLNRRGVVELTGNELVTKTKEDIVKLKKEMHSSEKVYSNMLGHDKYQAMQQRIDKQKRG
jgi:putative FmdB family regulatory protein